MTSFDFLPREEPGAPLYQLPADFVDQLMVECHRMQRRRKAKRASAILVLGFCAVGLTYGTFRSYSPAVRYEIPVAARRPPAPPQVVTPKAETTTTVAAAAPKPKHTRKPKPQPQVVPPPKEAPVQQAAPKPKHLPPCNGVQAASDGRYFAPCVPLPNEPQETTTDFRPQYPPKEKP